MNINVIIPTYNRAKLLRKTLHSIGNSSVPKELEIIVTVVNNNSSDETESVFEELKTQYPKIKFEYLFEPKQGRSAAVNAGISHSKADLISMLDDDIRITPEWFEVIGKVFSNRSDELDFIGGRVLPDWEIEPPSWVEPLKRGVISLRDYGDEEWFYSKQTPMLSGGHAVFKASVFKEIGLYPLELGTSGKSLISCEDDIFYDELIKAGKKGIYCPDLKVYHFVPKYRLTKSYYRQWCFNAGISWHLMDEHYGYFASKKLFGVPRYLYSDLLKNSWEKVKAIIMRDETKSLDVERMILIFGGFFYSRNLKESRIGEAISNGLKKKIKPAER